MASCPRCGFEVFGEVCPSCGTENPHTVTRSGSIVSRRNQAVRSERFQPPPAPKNQPALLHDASPVFSPVYDELETAAVQMKPEISECQPEDNAQSILQPESADAPVIAEQERQETEVLPEAQSEPLIKSDAVTEQESEVFSDDSEEIIPEQTAYDSVDPKISEDSILSEPVATTEAEMYAVQEDIPGEDFSAGLPTSLSAAETLFRCMIRGEFESAAEQVTFQKAVPFWKWLLPLHILCGSTGAAVLGNNIEGFETFRRFGAALGAGAIIWCEHFIVLLILLGLLFSLTGCRMRPMRVLETACTAVLPLAAVSIPAGMVSFVSVPVGLSLLIFGEVMSAFCIFSFANAAGVFRVRYGKMLTGLALLADIIFASLLINSII